MTQTPEIPAFAFSDANLCPMTSDTVEHDGFTLRATIYADDNAEPPWAREDGHGVVSGWTRRAKGPGELVLAGGDGSHQRFYDFASACKTALADQWGVSPYRLDTEHGANGLVRVTGHWFEGRELQTFRSDWSDDANAAISEVYAAHRATFPSAKAYAARAARADFHRLKGWSDNQWQYVGVAVTVARDGVILTGKYDHALWGIESDSPGYLAEVANDLAGPALDAARAKLASMTPPDAASLLLDRCEAFLAGFEDDDTQSPVVPALLADLRARRGGSGETVLQRFERLFPGEVIADPSDREAFADMPIESTCGDACRKAIDAAAALAASIRQAYGEARPDLIAYVHTSAVETCGVFICG